MMSDALNDEEEPVLDLLARMTADSVESSNLDAETLCSCGSPHWSRSTRRRCRTR